MGRNGITFDQVAAAAESLIAEASAATLKAVRDKLGTGSMGTVQRHLAAWHANRPKPARPVVELPAEIARAMNGWVLQASTTARATAEESLAQAQSAAAELARAVELLEAERDELIEQAGVLATERDRSQATAEAHASAVEKLTHDVARERDLAGKAQVDAAQAKNKLESQTEQLAEMRKAVAALTAAVEGERQSRINAERAAAVLLAERDGARRDAADERGRITGVQSHLDVAHEKAEKTQVEYEKRLAAERSTADKSAAEAKTTAVDNADLKARLEAAQQAVMRLEAASAG